MPTPAQQLRVRTLAALAALLAAGAPGCGSAKDPAPSKTSSTANAPAYAPHARAGYLKLDGDADNDDSRHPNDSEPDELPLIRQYGALADPSDAHAIANLVRRYYLASAAGNATLACSLMYSGVLEVLAAQRGASGAGRTQACAKAFTPMLAQQHQRFASEEPATMTVIAVHTQGNLGLAVLGFRHTPESEIVVERERGAWRIDTLLASYMP